MERVELLTVEESFQLSQMGLVLVPDFSVPRGNWKNFSDTVVLARPDGHEFEVFAQFNMSHFNIRDPNVSADKRWRVVVLLPELKKVDVPIGSKILVSSEVKDAVLIGNAA